MPPILVVEDDPTVRQLVTRMLNGAGYDTLEARNGEEALREMQCRNGEVALVLSDIRMPRMDGIELAKNIATQFPRVRTVLMSAFAYDPIPLAKTPFFLSKPFTATALVETIRLAIRPKHAAASGRA